MDFLRRKDKNALIKYHIQNRCYSCGHYMHSSNYSEKILLDKNHTRECNHQLTLTTPYFSAAIHPKLYLSTKIMKKLNLKWNKTLSNVPTIFACPVRKCTYHTKDEQELIIHRFVEHENILIPPIKIKRNIFSCEIFDDVINRVGSKRFQKPPKTIYIFEQYYNIGKRPVELTTEKQVSNLSKMINIRYKYTRSSKNKNENNNNVNNIDNNNKQTNQNNDQGKTEYLKTSRTLRQFNHAVTEWLKGNIVFRKSQYKKALDYYYSSNKYKKIGYKHPSNAFHGKNIIGYGINHFDKINKERQRIRFLFHIKNINS